MTDLLKRKTTWAGLALIVAGIGQWVAEGNVTEAVTTILEGIGLIVLRASIAKVAPKA